MGVLGVLVAALWYLSYRDRVQVALDAAERAHLDAGLPPQDAGQRLTFADWLGLFRRRLTWGVVIGYVGIIYMLSLFLTWLPAYLERVHHLSLSQAGWVASLPFLAGACGVIGGGLLVDRLTRSGRSLAFSRKLPICGGLAAAGLFALCSAGVTGIGSVILRFSLALFSLNVAVAGTWSLVSVAVPSHQVASLASIQNFGGYFGGAFAPVITGMIVQQTGSFGLALGIAAAVAVAGALSYGLLVRLPDTPS